MQVERGLRGGVVMMFGLLVMAVRKMSMMTGVLMVAFLVVTLRGAMMLGSLFVVLGRSSMMFGGGFRVFHGKISLRARRIGPRSFMPRSRHAEMTGGRQSCVRPVREVDRLFAGNYGRSPRASRPSMRATTGRRSATESMT
jgi:hypothetical protein